LPEELIALLNPKVFGAAMKAAPAAAIMENCLRDMLFFICSEFKNKHQCPFRLFGPIPKLIF
jgi:hypothetical protein